ncbi:MAG: creatininase [Chloroflexota bacterium]|nr:creatininase [Chloroflexota bacterium]
MNRSVNLNDLTWTEIAQAIRRKALLMFSVGSIEQHGYHLPLGVDTYLPLTISQRVAGEIDAVVAPPINYGYKSLYRSGGGPNFPGSIGVKGRTLISMVSDIFQEFINQGWKYFLVLDWHLENVPFVYEGIDEALAQHEACHEIKIVKIDNPNGLAVSHDPDLMDFLFGEDFPGWAVEHASIWETSAMMSAYPELVNEDEIRDGSPPEPFEYDLLPVPKRQDRDTGVFWKASQATPEKGQRILNAATQAILKVIHEEFPEISNKKE